MAVCSFLGHWSVYDADIEYRLQAAVDEVVRQNESVDFWLHPWGEFFNYCFLAVLRAKTRSPQTVKICLIVSESQYTDIMQQKSGSIPACMIDEITMYRVEHTQYRDWMIPYRMLQRFIVQKSTYIIKYIYKKLYDTDRKILDFSENRQDTEVISVSSEETERIIIEHIGLMPEQEQHVFQKIDGGCTLKEAGAALGVGKERTRQILHHGCAILKKSLERRRNHARATLGGQEYACGIFTLGRESYSSMRSLQCVIDFLTSAYQVKKVYIDQRCAESGFMMILKGWYPFSSKVHVTAVTDAEPFSEADREEDILRIRFCPPCDAVRYVGWPGMENDTDGLAAIADVIGRSDFCLFHGSAARFAEEQRRAVCQKKTVIFVDIGKKNSIQEGKPAGGIE